MKRSDADATAQFIFDVLNACGLSIPDVDKALGKYLEDVAPEGQPGTGVCICKLSPELAQRTAERMLCTLEAWGNNMLLDHRCAHHGEKAQPALWGRHKEKELLVTPVQWLSLGVTGK